jgi:PAS domain S-box-containing protein
LTHSNPKIEINYLDVIEAAPESILITSSDLDDPGPSIVYVNPAFERMTGWDKTEILGKSPRLFQGPKTNLKIFSDLRKKLYSNQVWEGQTINYRKDGSVFWMEWSIVPLKNQEENTYQYLAIQRDISARVEAELRLQEARAAEQAAERARANLSRYFPPKIVDTLADKDRPLGIVKRQNLAVLFADIMGFTKLSGVLEPEQVIEILRDVHKLTEQIIFKWDGFIEGYIGDAILAVFGFPESGGKNASNALSCGYELLSALEHWNKDRTRVGLHPVHFGIGINYGPVVLGDIGTENQVEFTVIGDTVNTASRLQQSTRTFQCDIVVSKNLVDAVLKECGREESSHLIDRLHLQGKIDIRGRAQGIEVSTFNWQK